MALGVRVHTRHMVRGIERMADQNRIGTLGIERAIGFIHQLVCRQHDAALQQQRLGKSVCLGRNDHSGLL